VTGPLPVVRRRVAAVDRRWRDRPLRTRLTAAAATAATLTIVAVVAVAYIAVRHELRGQVDTQLRHQASEIFVRPEIDDNGLQSAGVHSEVGDVGGVLQVLNSAGQFEGTGLKLPIDTSDKKIAADGGTQMRDADIGGVHFRMLTKPLSAAGPDVAVEIALPLTQVDSQLHKLRLAFLFLALFGLGLVVLGSWFVVRRTLRPVASLTEAAERIAVTRDLTTRIEDYGDDELGRLASTFNTMLDALERSLGQQRQLILDASHELRTPLASLRTNVEVLHDVDRLSVEQRRALLDGVVTQLDELTGLVADVVELARGDAPESAQEDVVLDDLLAEAVDRARRHWPHVIFMLAAEPVTVRGVPNRLDRAIANLLDNAGKFSPAGAVVDVSLTSVGVLTVADRGPGVPAEAVAQVFDRFYRADEARALPGSGLGLAIVKQVIDGHQGTVVLSNRPDGGAIVTVTLSPVGASADAVPVIEAHVETQPVG
jgi:two-component system, OmpR family, sensor histidine kinase MprB